MLLKFIGRILVFIVPLAILFLVYENLLRKIPNDYSYQNQYLTENSHDLKVLVLGNSHMYRGVIAEELEMPSFNASYVSQTLDFDTLIFEKYQDDFENLRYLILGVSYPSLFSSLKDSKEAWRIKNYNLYFGFGITIYPKNYSEILGTTSSISYQRFFDYYFKNRSLITTTKLGSGPLDVYGELEESGKRSALRHSKPNLAVYIEKLNMLDEIIHWAEKNEVSVLLLTPPVYESYFKNLNQKQLDIMNESLNSRAEKYSMVHRLDFMRSEEFDSIHFKDGDHLNKEGAMKLSQIIDEKLLELERKHN